MQNFSDFKDQDPLELFKAWFQMAKQNKDIKEPRAMVLSTHYWGGALLHTTTTTLSPYPKRFWNSFFSIPSVRLISSRVVLLKEIDPEGLIFYTNYKSLKAGHLRECKNASLLFYWPALNKQVRLEGRVKKTSREESLKYWDTRPFESQISQYVSRQSYFLESRKVLEHTWDKVYKQFQGKKVPCPRHWGGYVFRPYVMEFWQERPHRLHDRLLFKRGRFFFKNWQSVLLYP